jgi:hypothetical protein
MVGGPEVLFELGARAVGRIEAHRRLERVILEGV